MRLLPAATFLALFGCLAPENQYDPDKTTDGIEDTGTDADDDGFDDTVDCDDADASVNPEAEELCDDVDNDCDGAIDEGLVEPYYYDGDGDSHGDADNAVEACEAPADFVAEGDDCDDNDADTYPGASERCDSLDNDCDTEVDEDVLNTWYADGDDDGYGHTAGELASCDPPAGYADNDQDCDDADAAIYPGAEEVCDGADNDCDAATDEGVTLSYYADADSDGYGNVDVSTDSCDPPAGYVDDATDCDDSNPSAHPGATEVCDGADNDCDGLGDENDAADAATWYSDSDSDGYGNSASSTVACNQPTGMVADDNDCDDTEAAVNPDATEICDEIDNDCNGVIDQVDDDGDSYISDACGGGDCDDTDSAVNPAASETWYDGADSDCGADSDYDADSDGHNSDAYGGTDCNDSSASVNPDASDGFYDGVDSNCDGASDFDADADGYDSDAYGGTDCDDTDDSANPGETDTWYDGVDSDCGGNSDFDADGDGYFSDTFGGTDCDDTDDSINPLVTEIWYDGVDSDCDSGSDYDADGDGFTSDTYGGADCDDAAGGVYPTATDLWYDGIDTDCDGADDYDADEDGYTADGYGGDDCDDVAADTNPGASDTWYDGVDTNCDDASDYDADSDGYDSDAYGGDDCDDADSSYSPGIDETWYDGVDADCDGLSDYDADADGHDSDSYSGDDCDDSHSRMNPTEEENCRDGLDNDCNGEIDDCDLDIDVALAGADAIYRGEDAGDRAGQGDPGIAGAGDVNGDGFDDVIVSAIRDDDAASNAGAVYVLFGPLSGDNSLSTANAKLTGEVASDLAGRSVAGIGDANNDGYDDMVISALGNATGGTASGSAYLVHGPVSGTSSLADAAAKFIGEDADDGVGDVAWVGDINSDGYADMLVAAQYNSTSAYQAGTVYLLHGPATGEIDLSAADARMVGESSEAEAGSAMWGAGDFDADGVADIIIGANGDAEAGTDAGAAYLVTGPVTGDFNLSGAYAKWTGEAAGDTVGWGASVAEAGDLNGDGYDDVAIGARFNDGDESESGAVYIMFGPGVAGTTSLSSAGAKLSGEEGKDLTGDSLHGIGDFDGDLNDDIVIGSSYSDAGATNGGAIYLVLGPVTGSFSLSASNARFTAEGSEDRARTHGAGDVNADGRQDFLVGAQNNSSQAGAVYLIYGNTSY